MHYNLTKMVMTSDDDDDDDDGDDDIHIYRGSVTEIFLYFDQNYAHI